MTQKIFDVDNKEDMDLLWSILPDDYYRIEKRGRAYCFYKMTYGIDHYESFANFFNINWHDRTEITRPVNYEHMIGCVGWFWNGEQKPARPVLSVLAGYDDGFWTVRRESFEHFMTAKKSDLKFYGEQDE